MNGVLRHIRRAAFLHARDGPTDAQLLESFLTLRDETAFEALLRRHGKMVLGVCYRVPRLFSRSKSGCCSPFGPSV
jgi:hypothetical protein